MRVSYDYLTTGAHWVGLRIPFIAKRMAAGEPWASEPFGAAKTLLVVDDNHSRVLGGVVYHGYDPFARSIELSFAAEGRRWLTRPIICELLNYPFVDLSCRRVTGVTPRRATSARHFLDQFGFKREGLVRRGFGDDDAVISGLLSQEWERSKWSKPLPERLRERAAQDGEKGQRRNSARSGGHGSGADPV